MSIYIYIMNVRSRHNVYTCIYKWTLKMLTSMYKCGRHGN